MRTMVLTRTGLLLLLGALASCGGLEPEEELGGSSRGKADRPAGMGLRLLTYNVGLAHGAVALARERLPLLPAEVKKTGADVVCLNEVWEDADYESLRGKLADLYPYAFRERTTDSSWPKLKCLPWTVYRLDSCMKSSCTPKGISAEECMRGPCQQRYDALSDGCKTCLAANTASPLNCVIWGARDYAFGGRNGLALFSKTPFQEVSYQAFETKMIKRGVITARIDDVRIHCTHLSSDLVIVPYPGGGSFGSWQEEQAAQIDRLAPPDDRCTILMGDLNTGPAVGSIKGEVPESYQSLLQLGYQEPWDQPTCTFCTENPLAGSPSDLWLDHIMLSGCPQADPVYRRALDRPVDISAEAGVLSTRYSDHYGVAVGL